MQVMPATTNLAALTEGTTSLGAPVLKLCVNGQTACTIASFAKPHCSTDTMRSLFAQPDHMGVFHYVVDCPEDLNMIAMIATSDRPCWRAEACKSLLLLLASVRALRTSTG